MTEASVGSEVNMVVLYEFLNHIGIVGKKIGILKITRGGFGKEKKITRDIVFNRVLLIKLIGTYNHMQP